MSKSYNNLLHKLLKLHFYHLFQPWVSDIFLFICLIAQSSYLNVCFTVKYYLQLNLCYFIFLNIWKNLNIIYWNGWCFYLDHDYEDVIPPSYIFEENIQWFYENNLHFFDFLYRYFYCFSINSVFHI